MIDIIAILNLAHLTQDSGKNVHKLMLSVTLQTCENRNIFQRLTFFNINI